MNHKKRILVAPLSWGLGHASRCIPIIRALLSLKAEVILGGDGAALKLLKQEFPGLESVSIPDMEINYPRHLPFAIHFGLKFPRLLEQIQKEQAQLKNIIKEKQLTAVVSDNRYGLYSDEIPSVIITHQLRPISPFFESTIAKFISKKVERFEQCWVPDFENEPNLSGKLSHFPSLPKNVHFIGPLSRFRKEELKQKYKITAILSGPEPNRSHLEKVLVGQLNRLNVKSILVRGVVKTSIERKSLTNNLEVVSHLPSDDLNQLINQSDVIICRAGYSSIMDLVTLKKKAILIPTKGQSEQEYLAMKMQEEEWFYAIKEKDLNLMADVTAALKLNTKSIGFQNENQFDFFEEWLDSFK